MQHVLSATWPAPKNIIAFTTTRQTDFKQLTLPHTPVKLDQVHGTDVIRAEFATPAMRADAMFTTKKNIICSVKTADCLPILICDKQGTCVAAVHAGWRGLSAGVIEKTIQLMPTNPIDLLVWLGPAIGPEAFEVGEDVLQAFVKHSPEALQGFKPATEKNKYFANLYLLAIQRLHSLGIDAIYGGGECTYSNQDKYYSYRRDKEAGRLLSLIWITE